MSLIPSIGVPSIPDLWSAGTPPLAASSGTPAGTTTPSATTTTTTAAPVPGSSPAAGPTTPPTSIVAPALPSAPDADDPLNRAIATALDSGNSRYEPGDFAAELNAMDQADKARLLEILNKGEVSIQDAAAMVGQFQRYYGGDNRATASALRELYYPEALDPFVEGAGSVDGSVLDLESGVQRGDAGSKSDAAFAQAVFKLSAQGENYGEESVQITSTIAGSSQSVGFDHIIGALDGSMNQKADGPDDLVIRAGVWALGGNPSEIRSVDAVTWLGDLAATVQIGTEQIAADPQLPPGQAALAGWNTEAPFEDRLGDIIGTGLQVDPNGHDLGAGIASAFDADSAVFGNRYRRFADNVGLRYDPATGAVSDADKQAFIDRYAPNVDALGAGLYIQKQPAVAFVFPEVLGATRDLALTNLDRWVEEVESGLRSETPA